MCGCAGVSWSVCMCVCVCVLRAARDVQCTHINTSPHTQTHTHTHKHTRNHAFARRMHACARSTSMRAECLQIAQYLAHLLTPYSPVSGYLPSFQPPLALVPVRPLSPVITSHHPGRLLLRARAHAQSKRVGSGWYRRAGHTLNHACSYMSMYSLGAAHQHTRGRALCFFVCASCWWAYCTAVCAVSLVCTV